MYTAYKISEPTYFEPYYTYKIKKNTEITSLLSGVVVNTFSLSPDKKEVYIYNEDENLTLYIGGLSKVRTRINKKVKVGDVIGLSDSTLLVGLANGKIKDTEYLGRYLGEVWLEKEIMEEI